MPSAETAITAAVSGSAQGGERIAAVAFRDPRLTAAARDVDAARELYRSGPDCQIALELFRQLFDKDS
jgi:hypothetical protein